MLKRSRIHKKTASRVFWMAEFGVCFLANSSRWIDSWKLILLYIGALLLSGLIVLVRIRYYLSIGAKGWRIWLEYGLLFAGNLWWIFCDHTFFYMEDGLFFVSILYVIPVLFLPVYNLGTITGKNTHKKGEIR